MKHFLVTLVVACGTLLLTVPYLSASETRVLTQADNGKEIRVRVGDLIELALEEQGGTGYAWQFDQFDASHLELVQSGTKPLAEETRVGGPVLHTWQIKALKEGNTQLSLDYFRPWEGKAKAEKHYLVKINIQ